MSNVFLIKCSTETDKHIPLNAAVMVTVNTYATLSGVAWFFGVVVSDVRGGVLR